MTVSVLDGVDVLDVAMALLEAAGSADKIKRLLKRAEKCAGQGPSAELLQLIRLKITQMEDQHG